MEHVENAAERRTRNEKIPDTGTRTSGDSRGHGPGPCRGARAGVHVGERDHRRALVTRAAAERPKGAAYFRVENSGGESDRIVSARTDIADTVEIHTHEMDGGMMKMRRVESVEVPAGGEARFKPHGLHLMLFGLKEPLAGGTSYALTVVFEKAGELDVSVDVKRVE